MMILTRKRLRETLERIPDDTLRKLIEECLAIRSNHPSGVSVPRKDYRQAVVGVATHSSPPEAFLLQLKSEEELRSAPRQPPAEENRAAWTNVVRLDRIELNNFGSYRGHHAVDLAPSGSRNVTVFIGSNGDGKSTLFNAINWALFGDEFLQELASHSGKRREDLVSHGALDELATTGLSVDTSVVLWFTIANRKYYVRRRYSTEMLGEAPSAGIVSTGLFRVDPDGNHPELLEDSLRDLLSGLPKNVKDFYLFDGERINRFTAPGSQRAVKDAIRKIVGVTMLEEVVDHMGDLASTLRREQRRIASNGASEVLEEEERKREAISAHEQEATAFADSIVDLRAMMDTLEKKLRESPDTGEIQKRKDIHKQSLERVTSRQEAVSVGLRESLADSFPYLALPAVRNLASELNQQRVSGALPGVINQQLLLDLLEQNSCLCGRPLDQGQEPRRLLEQQLEEILTESQDKQSLLELFYELRGLESKVTTQSLSVFEREKEYWELVGEQQTIESALTGIAEELQGIEVVDREGWARELKQKGDDLASAIANQRDLSRRLDQERAELKELTAKVGELVAAEATARDLFTQANWAEAVKSNLEAIVKEYSAIARIEVERRTADLWVRLLPNVSNYQVHVTEGFELNVVSPVGTSGIAQLSMGQQQCLGLAFITAVAQVSETKPPLVIDMPFGRLADDVASEVAGALPSLTDQLVLFLLPATEWNERIQAALSSSLARTVHLKYDEATATTNLTVKTA